ncbi:ester cyclase [Photobacterium sp. SDRW27]|uniref:ester cyclase n=1 Tax=Photobacterium obscurum TaxID=2829490 RepID=UPI0022443B5B|nr:ester cyclase [Photobacterium obscurum]MCW8329832.1 ester cyclase [Photobacterium obscurum]
MDKNNEWVVRWFTDVWSRADGRLLTEYATDPFNFHLPGGRALTLSHEQYLNFISIWCQRFKDVHFTINDVINDGDKTVALYQCSATYNGGWARIPPKKQHVTMTGMVYFIRKEGMITDCWLEDSSFDLYQQLTRYLD